MNEIKPGKIRLTEEALLEGWLELNKRKPPPEHFGFRTGAPGIVTEEAYYTDRNKEVYERFTNGELPKSIAKSLGLTINTIYSIVHRVQHRISIAGDVVNPVALKEISFNDDRCTFKYLHYTLVLPPPQYRALKLIAEGSEAGYVSRNEIIANSYVGRQLPKDPTSAIRTLLRPVRTKLQSFNLMIVVKPKAGYRLVYK